MNHDKKFKSHFKPFNQLEFIAVNILCRGIQKQLKSDIIFTFLHLILEKLVKQWKMQIMEDSKIYFR